MVKNPPTNAGDLGLIPKFGRCPGEGNGNPLQCSCWRIPWMAEPGRLQSMGLQRVGQVCRDLARSYAELLMLEVHHRIYLFILIYSQA